MQLDIAEFYPSISEKLLRDAIKFGQSVTEINKETVDIILHSRQSLLFTEGSSWTKKKGGQFDVTMGSFDGAEVCELVGLFLLQEMRRLFPALDFGLYRDDGLACYDKLPGPQAERTKKDITKLFKKHGLSITIDMNMKQANFLDVTMNLEKDRYWPYKKENNTTTYINIKSNHPNTITQQLPRMIQNRISSLSSTEEEFNSVKREYNDALSRSGYEGNIKYEKQPKKKRNRQRRITWFNPPFSQSVTTNIGRKFLGLIDKHFPPEKRYNKIFNRGNLKVSYSCMPNMRTVISGHKKHILSNGEDEVKPCNCRDKRNCPLQGRCRTPAVVYEATITTPEAVKTYKGSTEPEFKQRFGKHTSDMKHAKQRKNTTLADYVWSQKEKNITPTVTWDIKQKSTPYRCGTRKCDICLTEKLEILNSDPSTSLNKKSEILNMCRHRAKFKLSNL